MTPTSIFLIAYALVVFCMLAYHSRKHKQRPRAQELHQTTEHDLMRDLYRNKRAERRAEHHTWDRDYEAARAKAGEKLTVTIPKLLNVGRNVPTFRANHITTQTITVDKIRAVSMPLSGSTGEKVDG